MAKFRKKTTFIEAVQLLPTTLNPDVIGFIGEEKNYPECKIGGIDPADRKFKLRVSRKMGSTEEPFDVVEVGDYIVKASGEFYMLKKSAFEHQFEHEPTTIKSIPPVEGKYSEELKRSHIWAVDLYWSMQHHESNLALVMAPEDCRFIGTYEECLAFVSEYQNQLRPLNRKKLSNGKEVRYRDVMRSNTLVSGFTFWEKIRIIFGSGVHVSVDTYLLIPYPFRADSDTTAKVMPTRLERWLNKKHFGGLTSSDLIVHAQCPCGKKFYDLPELKDGWWEWTCDKCNSVTHKRAGR